MERSEKELSAELSPKDQIKGKKVDIFELIDELSASVEASFAFRDAGHVAQSDKSEKLEKDINKILLESKKQEKRYKEFLRKYTFAHLDSKKVRN